MAKKRLFGTFGVRRSANDVLTPEFASRLAASYGSIVQGTVAIGGDTRKHSNAQACNNRRTALFRL